jgi:hypothetical protein
MSDITHLIELPDGSHFAILLEKTVSHGVPSMDIHDRGTSEETFLSYHPYEDEKEWKKKIVELTQQGVKFKAVRAKTSDIKLHVQVE